jgi:tRNA threonylcarbamoyladenosine biosynthesis protein TsaE
VSRGAEPAADERSVRRTRSVEETEALGEALAPALQAGDVVVLQGPLGGGKTRLVAGIVRGLGATGRARSPSFTLLHEYQGRLTLFHADLYRLEPRARRAGRRVGRSPARGSPVRCPDRDL